MIAALRRAALRLLNTIRPHARDADFERELLSHVALVEDEQRMRGLSPGEARAAAQRTVGSIAYAKELHRDARSFVWVDDARRDILYALRSLMRAPGFTAVILITLAIGIGANTAIFSVVHAVLLAPLPYPQSERLVQVWENVPGAEIGDGKGLDRRYAAMDVGDLLAVASRATTVTHLANFGLVQATATFGTETTRLEGLSVSGDLFPLVQIPPLRGRAIEPGDAVPGHDRVVVLAYDTWQRFGGGDVLGHDITFDGGGGVFGGGMTMGVPYTVVGIMPSSFRFPSSSPQFWVPRVQRASTNGFPLRRSTVARLAPGVTPDTAAAEFAAIRAATYGGAVRRPGRAPRYELVRLQDQLTAPVRPALVVLSAAVGLVLLIACVNVANLLLARGLSRRREFAVRAAIGAGRGRIVRQLVTESGLLAAIGGAGAVALATAGVRLFRILGTTLGRSDLGNTVVFPRLAEIRIDASVLAYTAAVSALTGLLFGLIPAARHAAWPLTDPLRDHMTAGGTRLKNALVVTEIALATVVLVGGGLLIASFVKLATVDPGFNPSHVVTFQVGVRRAGEQLSFAETLIAQLQKIPGVVSAGYGRQLPMVDLQDSLRLTIRRNGVDEVLDDTPDVRFVSRDYLRALSVPVLAGRGLTAEDGAGQPPVILINDALARRDFRETNPLGQTILLGPPERRIGFQVVGVVADVREFGLDREPASQYFIDMRQVPTDSAFRMPPMFPVGAYYVVRTNGDSELALRAIRDVVRQLDPLAPVDRVATMEQIVSNSMMRPRMYAVLVAVFAGIATALAAIGLYGVVGYNVSQRTREIGVRVALGAQRRDVLRLVIGESIALIAVGLAIGLAGAMGLTRYLRALLFGLTPLDPATFASVAIGFAAIAIFASYVPARRATAIDPLDALRCE